MGAGIAAGAFMDGFYKGYSLMDKSRKEKEELELKRTEKESKLKEAASKLDSEMATKVTSATKELNDLEIKEAKAYEDGDIEQVNALRTSKATLIDSYNNEFKVASTNSGKEFKPIEINKGSILPITSVDYNGVKYGILEPDKKLVDDAIANGTVKVTDDGKLGILYVNDLDGNVTDRISKSYEKLPVKEDKTGKDSDMKFAWKEHNSNLPEGETPLSLPEFKSLYWDKESTSTEQTYTDAKTRIASGIYPDNAYGNAKKLADIAIVNKYEKKGQFAADNTGTWGTQINPVTGEIIQTNSKTGEIRKAGQTITAKQAEAEEKYIEGKAAIDEIEVQLNTMEGLYKESGTAITSFGENPVSFILNKANDIIKLPTEDRATRAKAQQFSDATKISVASAVQPGALTQKDVDAFNPFIISPDDDKKTIKEKIAGQRAFVARNKKKIEAGLKIYNQQNTTQQTYKPFKTQSGKVLDINKYKK